MKIIHSADWHLGRVFQQVNLLADQTVLLEKMADWMAGIQPDLFVLAGDVFDKAYPGREAIELFGRFLGRIYNETDCAIVIIAGNHDSGELIDYGGILQSRKRVLVAGTLEQMRGKPLVIEDADGPVAISALPYADVYGARQYFQDRSIANIEDVLRAQTGEARARVPEGARWIVVAHSFVQGCSGSESERTLDRIGGIETISPALFDGAHYVALGHLHRKQKIGGQAHIRYSGSLMRYGFDELDKQKTVTIVDMDGRGAVEISQWPLVPDRDLRIVEGYFDDLCLPCREQQGQEGQKGGREDFVKVRLRDRHRIENAMNRLRLVYPNIVQLEWVDRAEITDPAQGQARDRMTRSDPATLFESFFEDVTGQEMSGELKQDLEKGLAGL